MITGIQTMPSIAWFPLAILLVQLRSRYRVLADAISPAASTVLPSSTRMSAESSSSPVAVGKPGEGYPYAWLTAPWLPGEMATAALGVYTVVLLMVFKLWPVTLTLSGIVALCALAWLYLLIEASGMSEMAGMSGMTDMSGMAGDGTAEIAGGAGMDSRWTLTEWAYLCVMWSIMMVAMIKAGVELCFRFLGTFRETFVQSTANDRATLRPTHVAGVPPDYFSPTGQLWGNPLYNMFGWQKPCYLLQEGYASTFKELMEETPWEEYGRASGNPHCQDCMVHSGYEPTAVHATFTTWRGFREAAAATVTGRL